LKNKIDFTPAVHYTHVVTGLLGFEELIDDEQHALTRGLLTKGKISGSSELSMKIRGGGGAGGSSGYHAQWHTLSYPIPERSPSIPSLL
jgi:hypothetical protein